MRIRISVRHCLNLYRANFVDKLLRPRARHAHAPVQIIVPLRDRYVGPELSLGLEDWLAAYERSEIDAGHRVILRERAHRGLHRRLRQPASNGT